MTSRRPRLLVVAAVGIAQILAWGSSYYLPAVLAAPEATATGWGETWIIGALSLGLLVSGLVSPQVGHLIERFGGRPVLVASALLLAAGLVIQALAFTLPIFILAWLVLGLGMGAGLYDPAFATLGRLYGDEARSAITQVTLFAGFSSTLCWPLSAFFVETVGWRGASLGYAVINVAVVLPLYLLGVPREGRHPAPAGHSRGKGARGGRSRPDDRPALLVLAAGLTGASVIMTVVSVHLLTLLQARGLSLAAAVGLGALMGPSQVGARAMEALFGRKFHPIWGLVASTVLVAVGLALMLGPERVIGAGVVLYGAGGGIRSIARGTVPLAMFGREGYAILMGWLAMPSLLAQAASPSVGIVLIERLGANLTMAVLCAVAILNITLALLLVPFALRRLVAP